MVSQKMLGVPLEGHTNEVKTVAFSPDGKRAASSGRDGTILLWDVATQQSLGRIVKDDRMVITSIAFSPDGKSLVSGSEDGSIRIWDVEIESWQRHACRIVNRNLTPEEWNSYMPRQAKLQKSCSLAGE